MRWIGLAEIDAEGRVARVHGAVQEVTERKRAERAANELTERLHLTLESITDTFYTVDRDWCFSYVNPRAEEILGQPRQALLGRNVWETYPLAVGTRFEREHRRALAEQTSVRFEDYYPPLGVWLEVSAYPSSQGLAVYFRDVSARRRDVERLRLLEASVSQLSDMVVITNAAPLDEPGPGIVFVNDAFVRLTGYAREEVLGRSPRLLQGPLTDRAELARLRSVLERFEPVHAELVNSTKAGATYWVEIDIVPVGTQRGNHRHFVAVQRDISQRKHDQDALRELNAELENRGRARTAELCLARDEHEQANRAKSAFLATMSHEIRTPMNGVIGMIDVLHQMSLKGHQVEMVDLIRESAFSLLEIIEGILDFSKIEAGNLQIEHEPMSPGDTIERVCGLLDTWRSRTACG